MTQIDTSLADLDLRFRCPWTIIVSGPSSSGKTTLVRELLTRRRQLYNKTPGPVHWFYRVLQDSYTEMQAEGIINELHEGMCTMDWIENNISKQENCTIVLDDLTDEINEDTATIFSVGSHHFHVNVILICQNMFTRNPHFRSISINSTGAFIMKFPRDKSSIVNFAKQFAPNRTKDIAKIYAEATKDPHSYIYFDYHQETPEEVRIRSNIFFEGGRPMRIFRLNNL